MIFTSRSETPSAISNFNRTGPMVGVIVGVSVRVGVNVGTTVGVTVDDGVMVLVTAIAVAAVAVCVEICSGGRPQAAARTRGKRRRERDFILGIPIDER